MTRQEMENIEKENAIKELKNLQIDIGSSPDDLDNSPLYYALDIAIKALEQQPCEDCISREAVRKLICQNNDKYGYSDRFHEFTEKCLQLPPVTPSRPKGKWIHWTDDYKDYVTCSCCEYGEEGEVLLSDKTPFCPICGANMRESEDE